MVLWRELLDSEKWSEYSKRADVAWVNLSSAWSDELGCQALHSLNFVD